MLHVLALELCMAQALRTITARIFGNVEGSAALLGAGFADELPVFVHPMFVQNINCPVLCLKLRGARAATVYVCMTLQVREVLGADATHRAARCGFILVNVRCRAELGRKDWQFDPGITLTAEASGPASLCDVLGVEVGRARNTKATHVQHVSCFPA